MADNINFRDAFIICNVIEKEVSPAVNDDKGLEVESASYEPTLGIPFPIYHQTIVEGNKNHYCYLTPDLIGKKVLVFVHYAIVDESSVHSFPGYLGDKWEDVRKDVKVSEMWSVKKEVAFATSIAEGQTFEIVKYDGADKDEIVHPYMTNDTKIKI